MKKECIDENILRKAIEKIVDHHDILRVTFNISEESIVQINNKYVWINSYDFSKSEQYKEVITNLTEEIQGSIDLEKAQLAKMAILRLNLVSIY